MANFTDKQLKTFIESMQTQNPIKGSFSHCTSRFRGERDAGIVEGFIATIKVYKDVERITDEDAIKRFPLLLEENASIWWQRVKEEAKIFEDIVSLLRNAYAQLSQTIRFIRKSLIKNKLNELLLLEESLFDSLTEPTQYAEHKINTGNHEPIQTFTY